MKKILLLLAVITLFTASSFAQLGSSKIRIGGIVLKGKHCDLILSVVKYNVSNFPLLDSVLKVKYLNPPSNNADVTIDSVSNKEWLRIFRLFNTHTIALRESYYKDVKDELNLHGTVWIKQRIIKDQYVNDADLDAARKDGQRYGKKQDDDFVN